MAASNSHIQSILDVQSPSVQENLYFIAEVLYSGNVLTLCRQHVKLGILPLTAQVHLFTCSATDMVCYKQKQFAAKGRFLCGSKQGHGQWSATSQNSLHPGS